MADDNFDIDIYGEDDPAPDFQPEGNAQSGDAQQHDATADNQYHPNIDDSNNDNDGMKDEKEHQQGANTADAQQDAGVQQIASTGGSTGQVQPPKQAPIQQGMKRKQGSDDDRPTDPGASQALMISDLHWWTTEEDVRGWTNQAGCEDELVDVTFNEHKVNGKSKGQVYVQTKSPQAATALKHQLEAYYRDSQQGKKPNVVFQPAHINPFKTLPKDVPARDKNRDNRSSSGHYGGSQSGSQGGYNRGSGYGGRGGYGPRSNQMNFNRNFSGPATNMGMGGYGGANTMPAFGSAVGNMNPLGNFNQRGSMMGGMRGNMGNPRGRGGANMMGNMGGMGGMGGNMGMAGMGGMAMGMGMGGMPGNMGMMGMGGGGAGFGGGATPHFNPAFFGQNQPSGGDGNWNPHGAKRPRPE